MYARLEFNLCRGNATHLAIYRSKGDADRADAESSNALLLINLTNEQMTELVVVQKIKPTDMNR